MNQCFIPIMTKPVILPYWIILYWNTPIKSKVILRNAVKAAISNNNWVISKETVDYVILSFTHDDVIKWKYFPRHWTFVRGIHRSPVNSPHNGQWRGALMFSLICVWIKDWVNNREAGDLRRYRAHYGVIVMRATECKEIAAHVIAENEENIKALLEALDAGDEPTFITRFGKYCRFAKSARPISWVWLQQDTATYFEKSFRNLTTPQVTLKKIRVCYHLSEEELKQNNKMVEKGKTKPRRQ